MDLAFLTSFFGWMTLINISLLAFSAAMLLLARGWILPIHSRMTGLDAVDLNRAYFRFLAHFKLAVILLNLTPWIALLILA